MARRARSPSSPRFRRAFSRSWSLVCFFLIFFPGPRGEGADPRIWLAINAAISSQLAVTAEKTVTGKLSRQVQNPEQLYSSLRLSVDHTKTLVSTQRVTKVSTKVSTQLKTVTLSASPSVVTLSDRTKTITSTKLLTKLSTQKETKTLTVSATPAVVTVHVTDVVTSTVSATSAASAAALDVQAAINDAFAAVKLSESGLDNTTVAALEACLSTVLASGGLPAGYTCLTSVRNSPFTFSYWFRSRLFFFLCAFPVGQQLRRPPSDAQHVRAQNFLPAIPQ